MRHSLSFCFFSYFRPYLEEAKIITIKAQSSQDFSQINQYHSFYIHNLYTLEVNPLLEKQKRVKCQNMRPFKGFRAFSVYLFALERLPID